eukprot:194361-Pyramimonas_sp.AAC.1
MFLSCDLLAQASLGIARDIAEGRAPMSQEGDVEMCRCARSGILIIRLDQFDPKHVAGSIRPLHISYLCSCPTPACRAAPPAVVDQCGGAGIACVPAPVDHS